MKPAAFDYHAPETRQEALELLARYGPDAKVLAGGQSLVPAMNARLVRPAVLIDINRIADLTGIEPGDGAIFIGGLTRQATLERSATLRERLPAWSEALPNIGFPQIRNRGTCGGSLAHADPAGEIPALAVACGATVHLQSRRGERQIPAAEFISGAFATALAADELLVGLSVPAGAAPPTRRGQAFAEVARRQSHRAEAGAIALVTLDEAGAVDRCDLTLFALGERPLMAPAVGAALRGHLPTSQAIAAAAALLDDLIDPPSDVHASAAYRRHLANVLARRAIARASANAGAMINDQ